MAQEGANLYHRTMAFMGCEESPVVTKAVELSRDEREDIRFVLSKAVDDDEAKASACRGTDLEHQLLGQAERFRALARKVAG
jgi:hypothetical protein